MTILAAAAQVLRALRTDSDRACCRFVQRVVETAFDLPVDGLIEDWNLHDVRRPWSPVEAAVASGAATSSTLPPAAPVSPPPGRWAVCQGWRRAPDADGDGDLDAGAQGHCWLWKQVDATHGVRLDSATSQFRPAARAAPRGLGRPGQAVRRGRGGRRAPTDPLILLEVPMVRCKFRVESVEPNPESGTVRLRAVTSGSPENEQFFRWTPAGDLTFQVVRPEIVDQFVVGQEFYVDLTPAGG